MTSSGRFTSIDPLWEEYYSWTPYQYSLNRPISLIDFSGLAVAGETNWSSSSFGYAFSLEAQDEKREKVQNDDNEKTATNNTKENTQDREFSFWNYLWEAGINIPVWGWCQLGGHNISNGNIALGISQWLTGLAEAWMLALGYYSSAGMSTTGSFASSSSSATKGTVKNVADELKGTVKSNFKRFMKKIPANSKTNATATRLKNGNYLFEATSPGKVPGSKALYQKWVNPKGETIKMFKTTFAPDRSIIHIKKK